MRIRYFTVVCRGAAHVSGNLSKDFDTLVEAKAFANRWVGRKRYYQIDLQCMIDGMDVKSPIRTVWLHKDGSVAEVKNYPRPEL